MDPLRALNHQQGYFTRPDVLALGYDDRDIRRSVKAGAWRRLRVGTYTHADLWPDDPETLHRILGRAVANKFGAGVALSHVTAALHHGLRVWGADLSVQHVTRLDGGAGRTEGGVVHHEGFLVDSDLVARDGLVLTTPAHAALETASLLTAEQGLVTLDSVLQLGLCSHEDLLATYAVVQAWPGMQRVGVTARMADAGGESVGESRTRYLAYAHGLPAPETQFEVYDPQEVLVAICDLAWREYKLLVEFDGRVKYGRLLRPGEEPGDAVWREKRREDAIREVLPDWRILRLVWADLYDPIRTAARLRRLMAVAA